MTTLEIVPLQGLGPIRFGMSPVEVRASFKSNEVYEDWMGGNLNDSILYSGIIFSFDRCDSQGPLPGSKLIRIIIHDRHDVLLWGSSMNKWTKTKIQAYLSRSSLTFTVTSGDIDVNDLCLGLGFDEEEKLYEVFVDLL
jgi:hypothetical protein